MPKNSINLLLAVGALLLVTACFCKSDRPTSSPLTDGPVTSNKSTSPTSSKTSAKPDKGDFLVEHLEVSTPRYVEIDRQVKDEKLLTNAAEQLNRSLSLPHDIPLRTKDCKRLMLTTIRATFGNDVLRADGVLFQDVQKRWSRR